MKRDCPFSSSPGLVGDPVDTLTGACVERQRDFRLAGYLPFEWWRHYDSSRADRKFSLGWGQAHDFDCSLVFDQDGSRYVGPLGHATAFPPLLEDGQMVVHQGMRLRRLDRNTYVLSQHALPDREFVFRDPTQPARLTALVRGNFRIAFRYDAEGRLSGIVDSLGTAIDVATSRDGLVQELSIAKVAGRERRDLLTYQYDPQGNLVAGVDGYGSRFSMGYDSQHRLLRKMDRIGYAFEFSYDRQGRCIRTSGVDGVLENRLEYLRPGELTRVTRGNGGIWQYEYQLGKLSCIHDPLGGQQRFVYDDQGNLKLEIDTQGNVSKVVADKSGAVIGKIDFFGNFSSVPLNVNQPDPRDHRVAQNSAEYEFGRLVNIATIAAKNRLPEGKPMETNVAPLSYVEKANLFSSANLGFVVGRNWWPLPESGRRFDMTGDLIQQFDRHGNNRRWMYDGNGNITKYVDFDGGVWSYEYHSWNHLVRETNPLGLSNRMAYDSQENLTVFEDAGGTKSEYKYDAKDNLIEVRRHGQLRERYERDAAGNLISKYASDGRLLVQLEYGPGNLPTKRTLSSGDEHSYQYDEKGRYLAANTSKDLIEFKYDIYGNRSSEKRNGRGVEHVFRGPGQFGESLWLDKYLIRYEVARDGTLTIIDPCGGRQRIKVETDGRVECRFSNGINETIVYDEVGRCRSKSVAKPGEKTWNRTYEWSGEGELRRVVDSEMGTTLHHYDAAHRLAKRIGPNGLEEVFEFDSANNLIKQPGLTNVTLATGNRLATANDETIEYNDRNHICRRTSPRGVTEYYYDSRDQLVRAVLPHGVWEAEYDALGRRIRKTFNGRTTEYFWNTDQLAAEISPDGKLRLYIYADSLALTPLIFIEYDSLTASVNTGEPFFLSSDQIGTPVRVYDRFGNHVWLACVESYGLLSVAEDNGIDFDFRFPGHSWDTDLLLNYNRFRYYSPIWGRYLQSDPIGIEGGGNVYAYARDPLSWVDVRGLKCATCGHEGHTAAECPSDSEEVDMLNSAGQPITRTLVSDEDAFLNHALAAAGGSMEGWTEYKPNWWTSPDGRTHIEINMHGHENTNEGPHITVRRLDDTSGRYTAESKTFIQGWEQFKRDWANYDWDKHAENQNK